MGLKNILKYAFGIRSLFFLFRRLRQAVNEYEEFFVHGEHLDLERFLSLGVIDSIKPRPKRELDLFLEKLNAVLQKETTTKVEIVSALKSYLPNFKHEEKGKNLDQKM